MDRKGRDEMIEALLAFMRMEARCAAFSARILSIMITDKGLKRIREELVLGFCDSYVDHFVSVSPERWDVLRRVIAFLRTDLGAEPVRWTIKHWRQWAAVPFLGLLSGAAVAAGLTGRWGILLLAWFAMGIVWVFLVPHPKFGPEVVEQTKFWPFRTEEEWKACEHLLQGMDLPFYDPSVHNRPIRTKGEREAIDWLASLRIPYIVFLPITLVMAFWPIRHTMYFAALKE